MSTQVRGVESGVDSIMGLSTTTLAAQLEDVVAARRAFEERYPLVYPQLGPVLGRPAVARGRWAVIGDVFNTAKPASRVLAQISAEAASCAAVSPYAKDGLTTVADVTSLDGSSPSLFITFSAKIQTNRVFKKQSSIHLSHP